MVCPIVRGNIEDRHTMMLSSKGILYISLKRTIISYPPRAPPFTILCYICVKMSLLEAHYSHNRHQASKRPKVLPIDAPLEPHYFFFSSLTLLHRHQKHGLPLYPISRLHVRPAFSPEVRIHIEPAVTRYSDLPIMQIAEVTDSGSSPPGRHSGSPSQRPVLQL